ncbi:hypothetical protein [Dysgonomonas sp. BGC7]|uniref:hypothetical protein n=1 Tax=Dysgonomonas sp. BGC7 TaxID=1658008 RepID=UPI000A3FD9B4|nr:hypothetical protein [Dysgonomonas sp. BGC7]MBD8389627.1 hypothetical protein [Dysgonomonas sp. BGC7]
MKKRTCKHIQIIVALIVVLAGCMYVSKKEADYAKRLQEAEVIRYVIYDGELIAIPVE